MPGYRVSPRPGTDHGHARQCIRDACWACRRGRDL